MADRKEAERAYPELIEESGRQWLRTKPFGNSPRETARLLIDFGYVVQLLELQPGMSVCELGCGPGWMTRMAARHGLKAVGYDISPGMIEIAREQAEAEGVEARYEVADMEELDAGGRFLLAEPNWKHRFQGRDASDQWGVTELGYTPRRFKKMLREAGFTDVQRFHNNRKRLFGNRPKEIAAHLAEPIAFRILGPFWTQIWLRATAA